MTGTGPVGGPAGAPPAVPSVGDGDDGESALPVWRRLVLNRGQLDRAVHRRADDTWLAAAWPRARVLVLNERFRTLVTPATEGADVPDAPGDGWGAVESGPLRLVLLSSADAAVPDEAPRIFLGDHAGQPYFAVLAPLPGLPGARPAALREVGAVLSELDAALLTEAVAMANWHRSYRYSPLTGAPLAWRAGGWEADPGDGSGVIYPRTNPAVIVLVHDEVSGDAGRCLLTRQASWPAGRYSCVAGFVEPGEAAEAAVYREVAEETGVTVDAVRYVASQAWPMPASLMLGFDALADSGQPVVPDLVEISDARWFTRGQLLGRGPGAAPDLPGPISIAHELITAWRDGR